MSLQELPVELLLVVVATLDHERDISALARTNRRLYGVLEKVLYCHNVQYGGASAMRWALQQEQENTVQNMLRHGIDVSRSTPIDPAAVDLAAANGRADVLKFLVKGTGESTRTNQTLHKTLVAAVQRPDHGCIRLLFECGVVLWRVHDPGPLIYAASQHDLATVKLLLELAEPGRLNAEGYVEPDVAKQKNLDIAMAAVHAIRDGNDEMCHVLLAASEPLVGDRDLMHLLPATCARYGRLALLQRTLAMGLDPNFRGGHGASTPLGEACIADHEAIVQFLLSLESVDPVRRDKDFRTPLSHAARHGRSRICRLLLAAGPADLNGGDYHHCTPLMEATRHGCEATVRLLLAQPGIDVGAADDFGATALSIATRSGSATLQALLRAHLPSA